MARYPDDSPLFRGIPWPPTRPSSQQSIPRRTRPNPMDGDGMDRFRGRVYLLVAAIPAGRVATYGQIAALAGHPRRARHVGNALAAPDPPRPPGLPWHRVINAQGRISRRGGEDWSPGDEGNRQMRLLQAEGIAFEAGRVNLDRFRWRPEEEGAKLGKILGEGNSRRL